MGAGKSLISEKLAAQLRRRVISTDELIVAREGRPVTEIFRNPGEAYFRKVEKDIVAEAARAENVIIDCGGGVVLDPENIAALKEKGTLFYLCATPHELYQRVKDQTHRPLLRVKDPLKRIEELMERREAFYAQADYTIDTNSKSPENICAEIISLAETNAG